MTEMSAATALGYLVVQSSPIRVRSCARPLSILAAKRRRVSADRRRGLACALARKAATALPHDLPKAAVDRHIVGGDVVIVDRHPGQLDDAALDRVEQREVAHDPGKEPALAIAGAGEEEWRRRKIVDAGKSDLDASTLRRWKSRPRRFVVLGCFVLFYAFERIFALSRPALAIAMVASSLMTTTFFGSAIRRRRAPASPLRSRRLV